MYNDDSDEPPKRKYKKFTPEEDERLRELIEDKKLTNWVNIASLMEGRNVHQCRERWRQISSKRGIDNEWTKEEDEILLSQYCLLGRKWKYIQPCVPKHTLAQVKTRINYLLKKKNVAYFPPKFALNNDSDIETYPRKYSRKNIPKAELLPKDYEKSIILEEENNKTSQKPVDIVEEKNDDKNINYDLFDIPDSFQDDFGFDSFQDTFEF